MHKGNVLWWNIWTTAANFFSKSRYVTREHLLFGWTGYWCRWCSSVAHELQPPQVHFLWLLLSTPRKEFRPRAAWSCYGRQAWLPNHSFPWGKRSGAFFRHSMTLLAVNQGPSASHSFFLAFVASLDLMFLQRCQTSTWCSIPWTLYSFLISALIPVSLSVTTTSTGIPLLSARSKQRWKPSFSIAWELVVCFTWHTSKSTIFFGFFIHHPSSFIQEDWSFFLLPTRVYDWK